MELTSELTLAEQIQIILDNHTSRYRPQVGNLRHMTGTFVSREVLEARCKKESPNKKISVRKIIDHLEVNEITSWPIEKIMNIRQAVQLSHTLTDKRFKTHSNRDAKTLLVKRTE